MVLNLVFYGLKHTNGEIPRLCCVPLKLTDRGVVLHVAEYERSLRFASPCPCSTLKQLSPAPSDFREHVISVFLNLCDHVSLPCLHEHW